jgi:NADH dehydrogenase
MTRQPGADERKVPHVIVVGGGFGGLEAARGLRNAPVRITLIDRTNHHVFQPLLYQVATAGLSPADIAAPIRHIVGRQRNTEVLMAEVVGVDTVAQTVRLPDREIPYDFLVLATGSQDSYFGQETWARHAPGLKTLSDATAIRGRILEAFERAEAATDSVNRQALLTFVLVGAGPTGVEMAGAIAELGRVAMKSEFRNIDPTAARILLLEAGPRILSAFPEELARRSQEYLEKIGVEVRVDAPVEQIDDSGVVVRGERIHSETVLWTAGVAASPAGRWLNAPTDRAGRVRVQPDLSVPNYPHVFVIGDTATLEQDGKPLPGVAQVAMQSGRYVADVIRRRVTGAPAPAPFRYRNRGNLATVGRSFAIADLGRLQFSGFFAWLFWLAVHIFFLIGFRNRLLVMIQWAWAYFTYQRGVRLITPTDTAPQAAGSCRAEISEPPEKREPVLSKREEQPTVAPAN